MAIVSPASGHILERVLDLEHAAASRGLNRRAYAQYETARMRTVWAQHHQRRFALTEGDDIIASATHYDLSAIIDQQPVRVCGIGDLVPHTALRTGEPGRQLVDWLLDRADSEGAAMALLFDNGSQERRIDGFEAVRAVDLEISVAKDLRRGAPMTMIRGGDERDLAAIVAMGQIHGAPFRFHLARDVDFVRYAIASKRLLAGLGSAGARQLHFFIAEEGITAAAYVVISVVGDTWTIEECGDRDPTGARVGAILQALIAREPAERRPTIRAWLPRNWLPPQVSVMTATPSTDVMMVRSLSGRVRPPLSSDDVLYWRSDIL